VADEFPTLEVALAACVVWLGWRGWVLARGAARLAGDVESLSSAVGRGELGPPGTSGKGPEAAWLGQLARTALAAENGSKADELRERARRIRRRLRNAAARDLVVCAVLIGALAYARSASLGVSAAFFALGASAGVLLLAAVALRLWHDARVAWASEHLRRAVASRTAPPSSRVAPVSCFRCGAKALICLEKSHDLAKKLERLQVREVRLCTACGHLDGRVVSP
jgi:hypothetical protein